MKNAYCLKYFVMLGFADRSLKGAVNNTAQILFYLWTLFWEMVTFLLGFYFMAYRLSVDPPVGYFFRLSLIGQTHSPMSKSDCIKASWKSIPSQERASTT